MGEAAHLPSTSPDIARASRLAQPASKPALGRPAEPAFEVLLERLSARAAELEEKSKAVDGPADLPDALDSARASLEEALHLGSELLEAYRALQRAPEVKP